MLRIEDDATIPPGQQRRRLARLIRGNSPWQLARKGARHGLRRARSAYLRQANQRFDRACHVETGGIVPISALVVGEAGKQIDSDYQAVDSSVFPLIMGAIEPIEHERFVFVDIGAGKGRAAFLAATYPFKRIIGIELADELCASMRRNIATYRNKRQRCFAIECLCVDATTFALPPENCVVFIFNTLRYDALQRLVKNLERWLREHQRRLIVLYLNPAPGNKVIETFDAAGAFRRRHLRHPLFQMLSPSELVIFEAGNDH